MLKKENKDEIIKFLRNRILELKHKIEDTRPIIPPSDVNEYGDVFIWEGDAEMFESDLDKYVHELEDFCDSAIAETTF